MSHSFPLSRLTYASLIALTLASAVALGASCASTGHPSDFNPDSGQMVQPSGDSGLTDGGQTIHLDGPGAPEIYIPPPPPDASGDAGSCDGGACADFPAAPINDTNATLAAPIPSNVASLFTGDGSTDTPTGGPCLSEPADGALFPYNWLQPRVFWAPGTGQTVFEVRISANEEANDYVVYTTNNYWVMDIATWQAIAGGTQQTAGVPNGTPGKPGHLVGRQLTFVVRGVSATGGTPAISNKATIQIAPALAAGSLIFWSTASFATNSTNLQGFRVGDNGTTTALTPAQVQQEVWAQPPDGGNLPQPAVLEKVGCIGCHTATPDGQYVGFTAQWPWPNALASVSAATPGAAPPWLTAGAIANLGPNLNSASYLGGENTTATNNIDNVMLGTQTFSGAHYKTGDRVEIAQLGDSLDQPEEPNTTILEPIQTACQGGGSSAGNPCPSTVISQLAWINLEWNGAGDAGMRPSAAPTATSNGGWGILARTGDTTNSAGTPDWSHDGTTVAYTSAPPQFSTMDGRLQGPVVGGTAAYGTAAPTTGQSADIKTIPYTANATVGGAGGMATPVPGASDPTKNEYFPSFSPDDALLAFNSVPNTASMYNQPQAEIFVTALSGPASTGKMAGMAVRLVANDPVACTGVMSPGVQNTWPKWAPNPVPPGAGDGGVPTPQVVGGYTYYWVTFSSTRSPTAAGKEQLYVAGITVDGSGNIATYPPIYLWNQTDTDNNLIPSWGEFQLPPPSIVPPPPPIPPPPK